MNSRFIIVLFILFVMILGINHAYSQEMTFGEALKKVWDKQTPEQKEQMLEPVKEIAKQAVVKTAEVGWEVTKKTVKFGLDTAGSFYDWMTGNTEEVKNEINALESLKCRYIYYYNNYNNSGKPAIDIELTTSKDNTSFYVNIYGNHINFRNGYYVLNKNHTGIICELNKRITSFPEKIKIEVVGPKSKQTEAWTATISRPSDK